MCLYPAVVNCDGLHLYVPQVLDRDEQLLSHA